MGTGKLVAVEAVGFPWVVVSAWSLTLACLGVGGAWLVPHNQLFPLPRLSGRTGISLRKGTLAVCPPSLFYKIGVGMLRIGRGQEQCALPGAL